MKSTWFLRFAVLKYPQQKERKKSATENLCNKKLPKYPKHDSYSFQKKLCFCLFSLHSILVVAFISDLNWLTSITKKNYIYIWFIRQNVKCFHCIQVVLLLLLIFLLIFASFCHVFLNPKMIKNWEETRSNKKNLIRRLQQIKKIK